VLVALGALSVDVQAREKTALWANGLGKLQAPQVFDSCGKLLYNAFLQASEASCDETSKSTAPLRAFAHELSATRSALAQDERTTFVCVGAFSTLSLSLAQTFPWLAVLTAGPEE